MSKIHDFRAIPSKIYIDSKSGIRMIPWHCNSCNSDIAYPTWMSTSDVAKQIAAMISFPCIAPVYHGSN